MNASQILNLVGLLFITAGSIAAALATPAPLYGPDGSVNLSSEPDNTKRIAMHHRQKNFPKFLFLVGGGAFIQAVAMFLPQC